MNREVGAYTNVRDQFLYTIGHLNFDRSVGRLDRLVLTNVQSTAQPGVTYLVTYHAKMPVAWGKKASVPATYSFTLPGVRVDGEVNGGRVRAQRP